MPSKPKSPTVQKRKALAVADWKDLYEPHDLHKEKQGPLPHVRNMVALFASASDAESRHYERMRALKATPERHLLHSVLVDIVAWTAAKPYRMRGFLVTANGKRASIPYLAAQLSLSTENLEQSLPILEQLGFLERAPLPEHENNHNGPS